MTGTEARLKGPNEETERFLGRVREIEALMAELGNLENGVRLVTIEGVGGIGKTALLKEFLQRVSISSGVPTLTVAVSKSSRLPLGPLVAALSIATIEDRVGLRPWSLQADTRSRWFSHLLDEIECRAAESGLVIIIDDLQLLDATSCEFLGTLKQALAGIRVLIVCATRPASGNSEAVSLIAQSDVRINLSGLSYEVMCSIAADASGRVLPLLANEQLRGAGGRPLLAREIGRSARFGSSVAFTSLNGMVQRELEGVHVTVRRVVQVAAVLGRMFDLVELAAVCQLRPLQVLGALETASESGLVDRDDPGRFVHDLVHEVVLDLIPITERRAVNHEVALMLQAQAEPENADRILMHLSDAGVSEGQLTSWRFDVAEQYRLRSPSAAVRHLESIRSNSIMGGESWVNASIKLVESLGAAGKLSEAEELAERLLGSITGGPQRAELGWWAGCVFFLRNRTSAASALLYASQHHTSEPHVKARLIAMSALSTLTTLGPDLAQLASEARSADESDPLAKCVERIVMSRHYGQRLELEASKDAIHEALGIADNSVDAARFQPLVFACFSSDERRDFRGTLALAALGRRRAIELATPWADAFYDTASANASLQLGHLPDASAFAASAVEATSEHGVLVTAVPAFAIAAIVAVHDGNLASAAIHIDAGRAEMQRSGTVGHGLSELLLAESLLMLRQGHEGAFEHLLGGFEFLADVAPTVSEMLIPDLVIMGLLRSDRSFAPSVLSTVERTKSAWETPFRHGVIAFMQWLSSGKASDEPPAELLRLLDQIPEQTARVVLQLAVTLSSGSRSELHESSLRNVTRIGLLWGQTHIVTKAQRGRPRKKTTHGWTALTATELLVAADVAEGLGNRQIARTLSISPRTVETHLASIRRKLQTDTRIATARAITLNMTQHDT
jgi:DNA-binding NarL/FixJ family response regulator